MKLCQTCEGGWIGERYCIECGNYDCCYYRFCPNGDDDAAEMKTKMAEDFARDMQGNPRFK